MKRLIITTTCRNAKVGEPSGHTYIYEPGRRRIIQKGSIIEPPYRDVDPNPRGGLRGGKGIAYREDEIYLANSVAIFRFNKHWDLQGIITHPACAGIHDILIDKYGCLWVSSARNDLLFKFDQEGTLLDYINFRNLLELRERLAWNQPNVLSDSIVNQGKIDFRDPRTHELTVYDGAHVNSISKCSDGSLLVSLGFVVNKRYSALMALKTWMLRHGMWTAVVRINSLLRQVLLIQRDMHSQLVIQPSRGRCVVLRLSDSGSCDPCLTINHATAPAHSLLNLDDDTAIYLNTTKGEVIHFIPLEKTKLHSKKITDKFLRGAAKLNDNLIIIGAQNGLITYDRKKGAIVEYFNLSSNEGESVFAIQPFDERYSLPPVSFANHIGQVVGFSGRNPVIQSIS